MLLPNKLIQFGDPSVLMLSEARLQPPAQAGLMKAGRKMGRSVWEGDEVLEKGRRDREHKRNCSGGFAECSCP